MSRDFAYKGRAGKGAVQAKKKSFFVWSRQLLFVMVSFTCIVLLFAYLSSGRRAVEDSEQQNLIPSNAETKSDSQSDNLLKNKESQTKLNPIHKEIAEDKNPGDSAPGKASSMSDSTQDPVSSLQFYQRLQEPLKDDYSSDVYEEQALYRVRSGLIRNKVNARSLKALLIFDGFNNTVIDSVYWNNQQWYQIVVEPIESRSRMNSVRDFFGAHDLGSEYKKIK